MPLFAAAIFLSAFLLFQAQPVIARYILPWYGGSPAVWTTCLLFFQVGLLGGYAYAHALADFLRDRRGWQIGIHLALLVLALALLPITPDDSMRPDGTGGSPVLGIVALLARTIGFPYLLLSASGPLLQHWFGDAWPGRSPYRLYAVSNAGSLLGLLTYPFLFEPFLAVTRQTQTWSWSFLAYAGLATACAIVFFRRATPEAHANAPADSPRPPLLDRILWIGFAACGSMLLLSLTNQMCQDVAVVPFLWVLPLSLYLLTFVISFDHERWYFRPVWIPLMFVAVGAVVFLINQQFADSEMHLAWQLTIYLGAIFCGCLVCHGEIVRIRPAPRHLTGFYLAISFGGALGGLFVSLLAPLVFDGYWELHLSLFLLVAMTAFEVFRRLRRSKRSASTGWAAAAVVLLAALVFGLGRHILECRQGALDSSRGFYGVLRVYEENAMTDDYYRALYHGRISHGRQYFDESYRELATTYYTSDSGIGAAFASHPARGGSTGRPMHVGAVGLGVGTIASYAEEGDRVRFYEINPQVETMARDHFTYLEDCRGDASVVIGDGRISLERELAESGPQGFDLLVIDAFSGDSIPIHLLTREAFALYFKHLAPDGILAVHISNLHLDLSDPVRVLGREFGCTPCRVAFNPPEDNYHSYYSDWVLLSRDPDLEASLAAGAYLTEWDREEPDEILWTDEYCNLLEVVEW